MEAMTDEKILCQKGDSAPEGAADHKNQITTSCNQAISHLETLWLFTRSDLKSMIYPNLVFGLASAMSGPAMTTNPSPTLVSILPNVPYVAVWLWLNLLLFNLANQRLSSSIAEDSVNKPWRPLPSKRISPEQTRVLLLVVVPTVIMGSLYLGAMVEVLLLVALTWMYNDLGGGDGDFLIRNMINALGMSCYSSGAIAMTCGNECQLTLQGYQWIALLGVIIMTTLQVQDMGDQEGDAIRERHTLPLAHGDSFARWTTAIGVMGWSMGAPAFWKAAVQAYVPPVVLGGTLTFRTLMLRNVVADKGTWRIWPLWMMSLYLLPLWL
jgi:4-hydroxybenzoate polyprenyltransferase